MFVGADDFFEIGTRDLLFRGGFFLCNALAQDFRRGLQIDHQVGRFDAGREHLVITIVELQLLVVQVDVCENFVFLEQEIGNQRRGAALLHFTQAAMALDQEIHLRTEGRPGFFLVEIGEERIVLGVEEAPRVQAVGQDPCQRGLADADRSFDRDRARRLKRGCRLRRAGGGWRHGREL